MELLNGLRITALIVGFAPAILLGCPTPDDDDFAADDDDHGDDDDATPN